MSDSGVVIKEEYVEDDWKEDDSPDPSSVPVEIIIKIEETMEDDTMEETNSLGEESPGMPGNSDGPLWYQGLNQRDENQWKETDQSYSSHQSICLEYGASEGEAREDVRMQFVENSESLNQQESTHVAGKLLKCNCCEEAFSQQSMLQDHQRGHGESRPNKCSFCESSLNREEMKSHEQIHIGEYPCGHNYSERAVTKKSSRLISKKLRQETSLSPVATVRMHLHVNFIWRSLNRHIQERSHILVIVRKNLMVKNY